MLVSSVAFLQDRQLYIDQYRDIAIVEMHRTGIPASIKLAQGILESNAGASMLAVKANNHFGMKCGSEWRGKTMLRKDDDRNSKGQLVKSCFRVFESSNESFVAHSEFLLDPAKQYRYGFLFEFDSDDYSSWAYGLKKAGYATNPRYPELLIRIIEEYNLSAVDMEALAMIAQVETDAPQPIGKKKGRRQVLPKVRSYPVQYHNKIKTVVAFGGESALLLAESVGVNVKTIVKYNESIGSEYETFEAGQIVYLQPKRGKYKGAQQYHIVKDGETMLDISDKYGIKTRVLYKRNGIIPGLQPASGQKLSLNKKNKRNVKVVSHAKPPTEMPMEHPDDGFLEEMKPTSTSASPLTPEQVSNISRKVLDRASYVVQPKDTLYSIARMHGLSVEALKKLNKLGGSTIHPGQKLVLEE